MSTSPSLDRLLDDLARTQETSGTQYNVAMLRLPHGPYEMLVIAGTPESVDVAQEILVDTADWTRVRSAQ